MRRTLFFIVALLGIEASFAACRRPIGPTPLVDPSGSTGINGLPPEVYHDNKAALENALQSPLTSSLQELNATTFAPILPTNLKLVEDTISCAVPQGSVASPPGGYIGPSGTPSLLNTTNGWLTAPLDANASDPSPQQDLHTCIATRMNPSGQQVTIWMAGAHVTNDGVDHSKEFTIDEAYWAALGGSTKDSLVDINVWPSKTLANACPKNLTGDVNTRVCGTYAGQTVCGVTVRSDQTACARSKTGWICPISPGCDCKHPERCAAPNRCVEVIKTKLQCKHWCAFYPTCKRPEICKNDGGSDICPAVP